MNNSRSILRGTAAAALLALASAAQAGLVYKDYSASADISGNLNDPAAAAVLGKRDTFTGKLVGPQFTEGLEGFANNTSAVGGLALFGGSTKTLTSSTGKVTNVSNDGSGFTGRYNLSPCDADGLQCANWWETAYTFTLDFGDADYSAFAFFGTDFSDFGGTVTIELLNSDLSAVKASILVAGPSADAVANNSGADSGAGNGSLLHFGFTDDTQAYGGVRFVVSQTVTDPTKYDFLGFDELILGNVAQVPPGVPEPGTLALAGLSLAGLAAARRKAAARRG